MAAVETMENAAKFKLNSIEIVIMSGLAFMFLYSALRGHTHFELRTCFAFAILLVWAVQILLMKVPLRRKVIRGIAMVLGLAVIYFTWGLWTHLFR